MTQGWKDCYRIPFVEACRKWDKDVCKSWRSRLVLDIECNTSIPSGQICSFHSSSPVHTTKFLANIGSLTEGLGLRTSGLAVTCCPVKQINLKAEINVSKTQVTVSSCNGTDYWKTAQKIYQFAVKRCRHDAKSEVFEK